ncbi:MAG: transglutaminase-like domain-containing protein [Burkholderiales bacterium]
MIETNFELPPLVVNHVRLKIDCLLAYELDATCEFLFMIHAAQGMGQTVIEETLLIEPATPFRTYSDGQSGNRFLRLQAQAGPFKVIYRAVVDLQPEPPDLCAPEMEVHDIPDGVLHFLMPTRYCESDQLGPAAQQLFGMLPHGYSRVQAICDWVRCHVNYRIGSTNAGTTARDVFVQRSGVCRDLAHLSVTFCRALNIPARLVCGYAPFADPPPDFHAIFEAWLGGRWVLFDPTGMAPVEHVVRVATGRDAKDVAFATIYGPARMVDIQPEVEHVQAITLATNT